MLLFFLLFLARISETSRCDHVAPLPRAYGNSTRGPYIEASRNNSSENGHNDWRTAVPIMAIIAATVRYAVRAKYNQRVRITKELKRVR